MAMTRKERESIRQLLRVGTLMSYAIDEEARGAKNRIFGREMLATLVGHWEEASRDFSLEREETAPSGEASKQL
jgi:hypothetical protein